MSLQNGFELLREERVPEFNSLAKFYRHAQTGAELLSLENDDENKVFGITFRTPAPDSTGLPHILEHSVLCGSRKYPAKEPFIELAKGSLNTFLNAFTYPDKTCYPVASQNVQDFYNLIDVYLDAVLYPNITPNTLKQEGWHYELEKPEDAVAFKGVVFNEMKGAYSSPDDVLDQESQARLYPDTIYAVDSGGDPVHIPDLTYAQFKAFHETYYHPSNARIYFYGDDDPAKRLEILDAYLRDFQAIPVNSTIPLQPRFDQPRRAVAPYETSGEENRAFLTVSWLLPEVPDTELSIGLSILDHILIGTPASPLRKALIDSGLGEDLTGRGLDLGYRQAKYSVGMKGVQRENTDAVEQLILDTLSNLAKNKIDPDTVTASLNTVEFQLREMNTGRFPRGLAIMLSALETWLYDGDPIEALRIDAPLQAIKGRVARGDAYFEGLLQAHLVNNQHRSTVILEPDPALADRRAAAEQQRLSEARAAMDFAALEAVIAETRELQRLQETPDTPEALATIPSLKLSDLDRQARRIPSELIPAGPASILYHDLFTNNILYLDFGFDLHRLPAGWLPYIPLFSRALTETGTREQTFVQLLQRIGRSTGGIHPSTLISAAPGRTQAAARLFLRGKVMLPQAPELFSILRDILGGARLDDRERFRQMALEEKASMESGLARAGHRLVNTRLRAHFSEAGWASEQTGGVNYLFFLRGLLEQIDQDWPAVQQRLEEIRARLVNQAGLVANVTLDSAGWAQIQPLLTDFLAGLPAGEALQEAWQVEALPAAEGLAIPSQVNFVGKAGNLYEAGYKLDGSILAIQNYLGTTWMWEKVRVQGGAYGGYFVFDHNSGVLSYLSYRDPNLLDTLSIYDQTPAFLRGLDLPESELTKSVIGAIGELDAYLLPDAKGYTALVRHLVGVTDEWRQAFREQLLDTSPADFHALADALEAVASQGKVAVIGSAEALKAANQQRDGWIKIQQVL